MSDPRIEPPPVEPTNGAGTMPLDPPQDDVSQDPTPDLDEAEHAALLATTGGTTAHAVLTYEASQIGQGEHPPGSNHNKYTTWYGSDDAWCFMFQDYCFNHLGALALVHGKHAYVPDFRSIFSPNGEFHTSSPRAGDLVAFDFNGSGDPEHIGIVEKVISSSVIQTIEGNTSDHVMRRTRSRSYVYGYATPKYGSTPVPKPAPKPTPPEDDVPYRTDLRITPDQPLPWDAPVSLRWTAEFADPTGAHEKGDFPGYISQHTTWVDTQCVLDLAGLQAGDKWEISFATYEFKAGKGHLVWSEVQARGTEAVAPASSTLHLPKDQHLYVVAKVTPGDGDKSRPAPKVTGGRWTVSQDKS